MIFNRRRTLLALFSALTAPGAALAAAPGPKAQPFETRALGKDTRVVFGQRLIFPQGQANSCNVVLHRAGDVLYIVDTGALAPMRAAVLAAAKDLGPVDAVALIATHAHMDHNANNDLLAEIPAKAHRFLMTAATIEDTPDQPQYFAAAMARVLAMPGGADGYAPPESGARAYWAQSMTMFDPQNHGAEGAEALDALALEAFAHRGVDTLAWRVSADCWVIPTRGHTRDSVVVYFPKIGLLAAGDETNRHFHVFHDADHEQALRFFHWTRAMATAGAIATMIDGHSFEVFDRRATITKMDAFFAMERTDAGIFLAIMRAAPAEGLTFTEIRDRLLADPWWRSQYQPAVKVFPFALPLAVMKRIEHHGLARLEKDGVTRFRLRAGPVQ